MGFFDLFFQQPQDQSNVPTIPSIMDQDAKDTIERGRLPVINTDEIYLQKNEVCYYADRAQLMNEKIILGCLMLRWHYKTAQ